MPLIAADELPLDVKLVGVPRGMDLDGAARMEFLGEFLHDGSLYALETPPAKASTEECTSGEANGTTAAEVSVLCFTVDNKRTLVQKLTF